MQIWLIKNPGNRVTFSLPNNAKPLTIRPGIFPQNFFLKNKKHHCGRENNHNGTVSIPVHRCIKPQHCIEVVWRLYNSSVHTVLFSTKFYWLMPFSKCEKNYWMHTGMLCEMDYLASKQQTIVVWILASFGKSCMVLWFRGHWVGQLLSTNSKSLSWRLISETCSWWKDLSFLSKYWMVFDTWRLSDVRFTNSMVAEEAFANPNEKPNKPTKKRKTQANSKKRQLVDVDSNVPAERPRGRPRKNAA